MRVPSGAYRPPTQSGEIERNRQKIDVLSRRQQRMPKIPPPPPPGGGIVGQADVWSDSGVTVAAGDTSVARFDVRWRDPDQIGPGDVSWVSIDPAHPYELRLEPGWYTAALFVEVRFPTLADVPADAYVAMWGGDDAVHTAYGFGVPAREQDGSANLCTVFNPGPFYAAQNLAPELRFNNAPAASTYGRYIFTITRLS